MATVHRIIEKHEGIIWAEAEADHGATFYFALDATEETRISLEDNGDFITWTLSIEVRVLESWHSMWANKPGIFTQVIEIFGPIRRSGARMH